MSLLVARTNKLTSGLHLFLPVWSRSGSLTWLVWTCWRQWLIFRPFRCAPEHNGEASIIPPLSCWITKPCCKCDGDVSGGYGRSVEAASVPHSYAHVPHSYQPPWIIYSERSSSVIICWRKLPVNDTLVILSVKGLQPLPRKDSIWQSRFATFQFLFTQISYVPSLWKRPLYYTGIETLCTRFPTTTTTTT